MVWTTPTTWPTGFVDENDFNEQLRDNMAALKTPVTDHYEPNEGADYTTASAVFAAVDGVNLALSITPVQADATILVGFHGTFEHDTNAAAINLDLTVDGTPVGGDDGLMLLGMRLVGGFPMAHPAEFIRLITGLSQAAHTIVLVWKTSAGNATLFAGAGTAGGKDLHPQLWAREVS